jgi:hypothetical protein
VSLSSALAECFAGRKTYMTISIKQVSILREREIIGTGRWYRLSQRKRLEKEETQPIFSNTATSTSD